MQKPFFSVVIPTLNEEIHLPKLLDDLDHQTLQAFDVWVVDAMSDDTTQTVVKNFIKTHPNVHLLTTETRHVSVQRNLGARKSTGPYIIFFDADTRLTPNFLQDVQLHIMRKPIDVWTNYAAPETDEAKDRLFANIFNIIMEAGAGNSYPIAPGACIGCSREAFTAVDGFDETVTLSEDLLFVHAAVEKKLRFELLKKPKFVFCTRRQRKDGYLTLTAKLIPVIIKTVQGKKISEPVDDYPMLGGKYFEQHKRDPQLKESIKKYYGRFQQAVRKQRKELKQELKDVFGEY
ncbi:MAG TPA: glycosyltransferase [Candidatus Saccharimonadia bacterium]|nr:glycosyltransferase [Candidatus Saccharimonadia bacterium]